MLFDLSNDDSNDVDEYNIMAINELPREPIRGNRKHGENNKARKKGNKPPKTFDEFYEWLLTVSCKKKLSVSVDNTGVPDDRLIDILPTCIVCSTRKVDVRMIVRSCLKSYYPCTGHSCKCVEEEEEGSSLDEDDEDDEKKEIKRHSIDDSGENKLHLKVRFYPCCSMCLAHVLWESSNEYMRSQKRYRGKCPFCKAAFCAEDLLLIDGVN